jgi:hypothetical protein
MLLYLSTQRLAQTHHLTNEAQNTSFFSSGNKNQPSLSLSAALFVLKTNTPKLLSKTRTIHNGLPSMQRTKSSNQKQRSTRNAAALPHERQAPTVCAAQGHIISADPSRTDDVVLFEIRQDQLDAFEILQENTHALLATGHRPTHVFQSFERLEGLLDCPIIDVQMDELYELDEDDLCSTVPFVRVLLPV